MGATPSFTDSESNLRLRISQVARWHYSGLQAGVACSKGGRLAEIEDIECLPSQRGTSVRKANPDPLRFELKIPQRSQSRSRLGRA